MEAADLVLLPRKNSRKHKNMASEDMSTTTVRKVGTMTVESHTYAKKNWLKNSQNYSQI